MNDSTDIERLNPTRFHPAEPATSMRGRFNLWTQLVSGFLNRSIREGTLTLRFPDGAVRQFGKGDPEVAATITKRSTVRRIALNPDLAVGEAYMDGSLCIDRGDIYDFLDLVLRNLGDPTGSPLRRIWLAFRRIIRPLTLFNPTKRAAQNVSHHYDLTDELYASFLDSDRSIPAPISRYRTILWKMPKSERSGTSPPSCCCSRVNGFLILVRAGAEWPGFWHTRMTYRLRA